MTHGPGRPGAALLPLLGLLLCLALGPFAATSTEPGAPAPPVGTVESAGAGERVGAMEEGQDPVEGSSSSSVPDRPGEQVAAQPCRDDQADGRRVLAVYVRGSAQPDRFPAYERRFRHWLDRIDEEFVRSSRINGGGWREVRYVRDAACRHVIERVTVPQQAMENEQTIAGALKEMGYQRTDRKYIVWYSGDGCGLGFGAGGDDLPGWYNLYNHGPHYAAVADGCWDWAPTLHELLHVLGAVNDSAPNATGSGHCWDDEDVLCYDDGDLPAGGLKKVCDLPENHIDCNGDDYFNTDPAPGSYLDTHWNVADSDFLYRDPSSSGQEVLDRRGE